MEEQASFETRAVLAPRRARLSRLALLVPAAALVAIAWAALSGSRADPGTAVAPQATTQGSASAAGPGQSLAAAASTAPRLPTRALGYRVHRLVDLEALGVGRETVIAVSGWYVATAITECPALEAIHRSNDVAQVGDVWDAWESCERAGILFATQPNDAVVARQLAVDVVLVPGVVMPPELEVVGRDATHVVVLGHLVEATERCTVRSSCRDTLVVDYVAWTPGA